MIEEVIQQAAHKTSGDYLLWLADSYDNLPVEDGVRAPMGTVPPINPEWRSPFTTIERAAEFIKGAPRDRGLDLQHFVVLDKDLYLEKEWLIAYKFGRGGVPVPLPVVAKAITFMLGGYDRNMWKHYVEDYYRDGRPGLA